jgi:plastocyanin domain-containing protein
VNVPVEMRISKEAGVVPHNIVINAPDAGIDFNETLGKEPKVIKFTPKKVGKYLFSCDKKLLFFKSHKDKGMEGVIEVVE